MQNKIKRIILLFIITLLFVQTILSLSNKYIEKDVSYVTIEDENEYIVRVYGDCKNLIQIKEGVIITITNKTSNKEIARVKLFEIGENDPSCGYCGLTSNDNNFTLEAVLSFRHIYLTFSNIEENRFVLTKFFESYVVSRTAEEIEIKEKEHIITKTISFSDMNEDLLTKLLSDEI